MNCRAGCGACCIAPSITSPIPGMPHGKPAGIPCVHLDVHFGCQLFGKPERPLFCGGLQPSPEMCGNCREDAITYLRRIEFETLPD